MNLIISLKAETIKIKRSAIYYLCFIVAAIVPIVLFFDVVTPNDGGTTLAQQVSLAQYFRMSQQVFNFIFLPLFIILISTLLLQIEYRNNTWKQVLASPQKLVHVYFAKYILLQLIIILLIASFVLLLLSGAFLVNMVHPGLFKNDFRYSTVFLANWKSYVSVLGLSAFQFWMALRFKNFIVPLAIGFCLWIMAPLMLFTLHWSFADRYPYAFPILLAEMSEMKELKPNVPLLQLLSLGYAVLFSIAGFLEFRRRRVST